MGNLSTRRRSSMRQKKEHYIADLKKHQVTFFNTIKTKSILLTDESEDACSSFAMVHSAWNKYLIGFGRRFFPHNPLVLQLCRFLEAHPAQYQALKFVSEVFFAHYNKRFYPQIHSSVDLVPGSVDRGSNFSIDSEKHLKLSLDTSLREWRKSSG